MEARIWVNIVAVAGTALWLGASSEGQRAEPTTALVIACAVLLDQILRGPISRLVVWLRSRQQRLRGMLFGKEPVPLSELPPLYDQYTKVFGNDILGLEVLRRIQRKNPLSVWRVLREDLEGERVPVGFFEVFGLTKRAISKLTSGQHDPRTLRDSDVCTHWTKCRAYYIASVGILPVQEVSLERIYKAATLQQLILMLADLNRQHPITLYARPATEDGLRLLRRFRFLKLSAELPDSQSIWSRALQKQEAP